MNKMKFGEFEFKINPYRVRIEFKNKIATNSVLFKNDRTNWFGFKARIVITNGYLFSQNAVSELLKLYETKKEQWLILPDATKMMAFIRNIDVEYDSQSNKTSYQIEFVECKNEKEEFFKPNYTFVREGENLFDVSCRVDENICNIFVLNDFDGIYSVKEGDLVWIN